MKNSILVLALLFAGSVAFAGNNSTAAKKLTVDKAISCFVKSLKTEAFTSAWLNGGKKEFMKKVKGNENYPVLGDQLGNLVSMYLNDSAWKSGASKSKLATQAADANQEKSVANALWTIQQNINPSVITEKGQKMMDKYAGELKALAS